MLDQEKIFFSIFNERRQDDDRRVLVFNFKDNRRSDKNRRHVEARRIRSHGKFDSHQYKLAALVAWLEKNCKGQWYIGPAGSGGAASRHGHGRYCVGFSEHTDFEKFSLWRGAKS